MRQIKASAVKPGMTIQWTHNKVTYECPVMDRDGTDPDGGVLCHVTEMYSQYVNPEVEVVTVMSEPQPEEPTTFGARVIVAGRKIIRVMGDSDDKLAWEGEDSNGGYGSYTWDRICSLGPVTVLPETDWTVPNASNANQEVPDRIEEWPSDDTALRAFPLQDRYQRVWTWNIYLSQWECHDAAGNYLKSALHPVCGPWTLLTLTHKNKENA